MALKLIKLIVLQHNTMILVGGTHTRAMVLEYLIKELNLPHVLFEVF